jgi:hypothetical protein
MTEKQLMALSDAYAEINTRGLEKSGRNWFADSSNSATHDIRTIQWLVDRGYLQLYAKKSVAHITDCGISALTLELECAQAVTFLRST